MTSDKDNHRDAISLLEIFNWCIKTPMIPGKGSPAHRKVVETINASGYASRKAKVGDVNKQHEAVREIIHLLRGWLDTGEFPAKKIKAQIRKFDNNALLKP